MLLLLFWMFLLGRFHNDLKLSPIYEQHAMFKLIFHYTLNRSLLKSSSALTHSVAVYYTVFGLAVLCFALLCWVAMSHDAVQSRCELELNKPRACL